MPKLTYTTPSSSLMTELREVASDADKLADELAKANRVPSDFPTEQLLELLGELKSLPTGTAEGCRQPLEYARARLPAIRRKFIQTEEQSRQPRADEDEPPPLTRGMTIDVRIGALVNSVTTALDEYRALASVEDDDAADTAPSLEIDATLPDVVNAMAASQSAEQALGDHITALERIAEPSSVTVDNLKRQMRDTRGLLSLARIELRMPAFVPRWYRKTIDTVRDYPRILRATAKAVRMGVDVARPMVNAWLKCEEGFYRLVLDSVEHATTEYEAVAQKWEVERTGQINESAPRAPLATAEIKVEAFAALQTEAFAASSPAPALLSPLGPLQDLPGTWAGTGFRVSWRPSSAPERTDYFLELTLTKETLRFARIHGAIPNRSLLRPDTKMVGLTYDQQITDNNNAGIHIESGYWITVPQTDNPAEVSTVAHMASTPYGTTVLAGTVATPISAAPSIQKTSISPFVIGNPQQTVQFPEPSLSLPSGLRSENLTGITQAMVDNPNEILTNALLHTTVTNTVMLEVSSSSTAAPVLGGGIAMPFLPAAVGQNAQIALVAATYWIETVTDDAGGPDVQQLQYTQTELLNFAGLSWPHITVATLRKMPPTA